jgi:hypothetical protein
VLDAGDDGPSPELLGQIARELGGGVEPQRREARNITRAATTKKRL